MKKDNLILLIEFIEKNILSKHPDLNVSTILLSGNIYFNMTIYEYLHSSKNEYVLDDIKGFLTRVWI